MNNKSPILVSVFTALTVVLGFAGTAAACPSTLDAGEIGVNCVPTDTGSIKIIKNAVGDTGTFDFVIAGNTNLTPELQDVPKNGSKNTGYLTVLTGTYSVSEPNVPEGWSLTSVRCVKGLSAVVDASNFTIAKGDKVTCTFKDTKTGHLIVQKTTDPAEDPTEFNITASGSGTIIGGGSGTVTDAKDFDYEVTPGNYRVVETVPDGWVTAGNTCNCVKVGAGETKYCQITNSKKATITIKKLIVGGEGTFNFTGDIKGNIGENEGTLQSFVAAGTFTATEKPTEGWVLTDIECSAGGSGNVGTATATFVVKGGDDVTCTFTNKKKAKIIVEKNIEGTEGPDFAFSGDIIGTIDEDGGQLSAYVDAGKYSVVEAATTGWDLTGIKCNAGGSGDVGKATATFDVAAGDEVKCTFTNAQKGHLVVQKTTDPAADTTEFDITASGSGKITGDGSGTVTDAKDFDYEVTPGTYSVKEGAKEGWTETANTCDEVKVAAGETEYCEITNVKTGHITVTKVTTPANNESEFTITIDKNVVGDGEKKRTLKVGSPVTYDVVPGTYSVSETAAEAWDENDTNCQNLNVAAGASVNCTIYNTLTRATLTLKKEVVTNNGGDAKATDWTLAAAGLTSISGKMGDEAITDAPVKAGDYVLSETDGPSGYTASAWNCVGATIVGSTVTLKAGDVATCTITNDDIAPKLTVTKVIVNGPLAITDFPLFIKLDGGSEQGVTSGVQNTVSAGDYTVSETNAYPVLYDKVTIGGDCKTDGTITLLPGDVKACTISNEDSNLAKITVYKYVSGGSAVPANFNITVNAANVYAPATQAGSSSGAVYYLDADQAFTVTETGVAGYTESTTGKCDGTLTIGEEAVCYITNTVKGTTLKLAKAVINDNGGTAVPADWKLTAAGTTNGFTDSGDSTTFHSVAAGLAYTLSESTTVAGYASQGWSCDGGSLVGNVVTLAAGDAVTCTITNNDIKPTLNLYKEVKCKDGIGASCVEPICTNLADKSAFTLYATGTLASPTNLSGVTPVKSDVIYGGGTFKADAYTLTEDGPAGYTGTWNCTGSAIDPVTNSVVVGLGKTVECTATNVKNSVTPPAKTGTLKVVKIAIGGDGTQVFNFTGTGSISPFSLKPVKGSWGWMAKDTWTSGTLTAGKYTITEKAVTGWKQLSNSCKNVRVMAGKEATCVIVNVKKGCENTCHTGCNKGCNNGCGGNWNDYGRGNGYGQLTRK